MIKLLEPIFKGKEQSFVRKCIKSGWITTGSFVEKFENKVKKYIGAKHAIACINGTSALHIALKLSKVKSNDEVIVPTLTFIAPVNAIIYNNAVPIFMDADQYYNIDQEKTINFINNETFIKNKNCYNKKTKRKISALIIVHVFGNAAKFDKLYKLCKKKNIEIIEDATESLGTYYKSGLFKKKHCGTISKIACLSFNGNKIISSGGGGMIITNNSTIEKHARYLINQAKDHSKKFIHNNIGYNYKMSNLHAAIGLAQLSKINIILKRKKRINNLYEKKFEKIKGIHFVKSPMYSFNNNWLNTIQIDKKKYKINKNKLILNLQKKGIETRPVWRLNHLQKPFVKFQKYKIQTAKKLVDISICIPSSDNLKESQLSKIVNLLKKEIL